MERRRTRQESSAVTCREEMDGEESLGVACREETDGGGKLKEVTGDVIVGT
jgi:hypothetical protein